MAHVPVIVGVRMSFALPVLFSAVRLYKRDASRLPVERVRGRPEPESALEPCWFADGGVCTSLPIHLFDKPMPRWPTFAVNLRRTHPDASGKDGAPLQVWMDHEFGAEPGRRLAARMVEADRRRSDRRRSGALQGCPVRHAAPAAARHDVRDRDRLGRPARQLRLATCRDRVAHVCLDEAEGAFNVDTDSAAIRRLAQYWEARRRETRRPVREDRCRGVDGAPRDSLHRRDAARGALHRRLRDRVSLGRTEVAGERAIDRALERGGFIAPPADYGLSAAQLERMAQLTQALLDEEVHVPEPGKPGWPDHPALKPKFVMRVMPDA